MRDYLSEYEGHGSYISKKVHPMGVAYESWVAGVHVIMADNYGPKESPPFRELLFSYTLLGRALMSPVSLMILVKLPLPLGVNFPNKR